MNDFWGVACECEVNIAKERAEVPEVPAVVN